MRLFLCDNKLKLCISRASCRYTPPAFRQFTEAVVNLKFDEEPKYAAYVTLFEPLCGPGPQRPILLEDKARVGQKRGRDALEEDMEIVSFSPHPRDCSISSAAAVAANFAERQPRQESLLLSSCAPIASELHAAVNVMCVDWCLFCASLQCPRSPREQGAAVVCRCVLTGACLGARRRPRRRSGWACRRRSGSRSTTRTAP